MANAVWPILTGPGSKLLGDPSVEPLVDVLESTVDAGRPKRRRLRVKCDERITGNIILTGAEKATFDAWFRLTIAAGTLPFEWEHPTTGATVLMRLERTPRLVTLVGDKDPTKVKWGGPLELRAYEP